MYDTSLGLFQRSASSPRSPVIAIHKNMPHPLGRLVTGFRSLRVPDPFKGTSSLGTTSALPPRTRPRVIMAFSSRLLPAFSGRNFITLRIYLSPCSASHDLDPLESHYPLAARKDTRRQKLLALPVNYATLSHSASLTRYRSSRYVARLPTVKPYQVHLRCGQFTSYRYPSDPKIY